MKLNILPKIGFFILSIMLFIGYSTTTQNHSFGLEALDDSPLITTGAATEIILITDVSHSNPSEVTITTGPAIVISADKKSQIQGDLNNDGIVSLLDLAIASKRIDDNSNSDSIDQYNDLELIINLIIK